MKNKKNTVFFLILMIIVSTAMRVYELLNSIDFSTAFYKENSGFFGYAFYLALAIGSIGLVVFSIIDRGSGSIAFKKPVSGVSHRGQTIIGVCYLLASAVSFYQLGILLPNFSDNFVSILLILPGVVGFLWAGFLLLGSKKIKMSVGILQIPIIVYFSIKATLLFISELVITHMSALLIQLIVYLAFILFLLPLGRFFSKAENKGSKIFMIIFGGISALLSCSTVIAELIYIISSGNTGYSFSFDMIPIALISISVFLVMFKAPKSSEQEWGV